MRKRKKMLKEYVTGQTLVTVNSPRSYMAEVYRTLRTNLGFAGIERPFRSVLITSSSPQDGKSIIVSNLAVVTALAGFKVILVDCDLRRPVQHEIFQISNNYGFTNCIVNNIDPEQAINDVNVSNLKLLTSGPVPPNPSEILNSERTRLLWTNLMSKYDYIFIDSPPVLAVTDACILASQADATLLVVQSGVTRIDLAHQVQEQLAKANAHLIGVILNKVKMDTSDYYHKY